MKPILSAILALCALCATAQPRIQWQSTTLDFGAVSEEVGPLTGRLSFRNVGDEPLVITAARATCGCTTPRYPTRPIAPGDTASVVVTYDSSGRPGQFSKMVYIDTNCEPKRSTLTICGTIIGSEQTVAKRFPISVGPLRLKNRAVSIGKVEKDHIKSVFVDGYNASPDTIAPQVLYHPKYIDVSPIPAKVPPGEQMSLNFYMRSDRLPLYGHVTDSVTIAPYPGAPDQITMPVTIMVVEDFSNLTDKQIADAPIALLSANKLDFTQALAKADGQPVSLSITLTNQGKDPMLVRRVYSLDPGISASIDRTKLKKGKSATITITVDPSALQGSLLNARIMLITNVPAQPSITLRAVGKF